QHCPSDVTAVDVPRHTDDGAPCVGPPVRREQAGESWDEVGVAIVLHGAGELLYFWCGTDDSQIVAQPLHQRTRDGDRPFEAVDRVLVTELVTHGGEQSVLAENTFGTSVQQ